MYTKKNRYSNHRSLWFQFLQNNNKQNNENNNNTRSSNDNLNIKKCHPCLSCKTYYLLDKRKHIMN